MEAAVISGILKIVSNKLAPLLIKEYSLTVGVQKHLLDLKDQIQEINYWLEAVGDKVSPNSPAYNWLRKLKYIAYDVDDIVDWFHLKAEEHDVHGVSGAIFRYTYEKPKSLIVQRMAASNLKKIKKRFDEIVEERTKFNAIVNSLLAGHPARDMSQSSANQTTLPTVDVASVLGRDQEKNQIISKLVDDKHIIKTISIIGLGGSGKSTLAKLVFNDCSIVENHFEVRLWVHVSQEFDVDKLIKKLFEAFADNNPGQHALPYMIKTISKKLTGKRVLLVLDDVWTESLIQWENFTVHIKSCAPGSRILLTARSRRVAETVQSTDQFDLPFLSLDESWQLFQQSIVIPAKGLESEFINVGKEIVKKCGGVPLAIKALGGVLNGLEQIQEWKSMRDSNVLDVEGKECIVSACLRLSYLNLPSHLKQCFTICSLFPKGHNIDKEQLIDLWIAHDMITVKDPFDYLNLEYVGHKHFNSLLEVSFLQNVEEKDGRVTCVMHDLVHDLALSILDDEISLDMPNEATSSTKRGYRYFSLIKQPEHMAPRHVFRTARAVYMPECKDYIYAMALEHANHLCSVMVGYLNAETANTLTLSRIKYLKYLAISETSCETLPEALSNVWSLQALHITNCYSLQELPQSIGKLKRLRTLRLSNCRYLKSLPESIGNCQMISSIDLCNCKDLTMLPDSIGRNEKLRVLRLSFTNIRRLPASITKLRNLECLDFQGCRELVVLPEGICILENLKVLNLLDCEKLEGMPIGVGQLRLQPRLGLFIVGKGEKFAGISELANGSRIGDELTIKGIAHVIEPKDAHMACLKQKTHLQKLVLEWMWMADDMEEVNTELQQDVLDGLEPPHRMKELEIRGYSGKKYAKWMQNQVVGGVQGPSPFPFLKVMKLCDFPNLKHLHGLVELPCLEELGLSRMPSLESISGGPFPSLVRLELVGLRCLGEVWMVAERNMLDGQEVFAERTMPEEGGCCCSFTPQLGQVWVGNCLKELKVSYCPKLEVKPHLPPSLQHMKMEGSEQVLLSPGQSLGSTSSPNFIKLKKLELLSVTGLGSGHRWEVLQHMTALDSLEIYGFSGVQTELPDCLWRLTSLRSLKVRCWCNIHMLPESLGELQSMQELTIECCNSLSSLPQTIGQLTSLQELVIEKCEALKQLPDCLGGLCSLRKLKIEDLRELTCLPESICRLTTSLQDLKIYGCLGLTSLPQGIEGLASLENLSISNCTSLTSLPQGIECLASLEKLSISNCTSLTSLPQGIQGLVSLEKLYIFDCPRIQSLPEGIKGLTALKELWISNCPDLEKRCERGKGEDWYLISRIPDVTVWMDEGGV